MLLPETVAVIVTCNGARWIESCLASLASEGFARIIIVDNASTDATRNLISTRGAPVDLIELEQNVGFGQANNRGIQSALDLGADYVALFNQDLTVESGSVSMLQRTLLEHPDLALVGALQLSYSGDTIDAMFRNYLPPDFWDDILLRQPQEFYVVDFVPAAAVMLRRSVLMEIGGFDPLFFMYGEDIDLCRRIRACGWRLGLVPGARVRHWHSAAQVMDMSAWDANRFYSLAVRLLKSGSHPLPVEVLRMCWNWFGPKIGRRSAKQLLALTRCLPLLGTIARHRRDNPFRFQNRGDDAADVASRAGMTNAS